MGADVSIRDVLLGPETPMLLAIVVGITAGVKRLVPASWRATRWFQGLLPLVPGLVGAAAGLLRLVPGDTLVESVLAGALLGLVGPAVYSSLKPRTKTPPPLEGP